MKKKILITVLTILFAIISCSGCALWDNEVNELNGSITGNTYNAGFYTNQGKNFMNVSGQKIDLQSNVIKEKTYNSNNGWGYNQTLSSVVTVIIDGKTIESCGSTMIFAENGLNPEVDFNSPEVDFNSPEVIKSTSDGSFGDNVFIASIVNKYKNYFGKSRVVVIQSQLGDPICAYSGNDVYWEVCQDLPKTTKLMIDGKALYIHRANFQIIDKNLL